MVPRGGALFWPAAVQEQPRALSLCPVVSRVASDALHHLRQALAVPSRDSHSSSTTSSRTHTSSCAHCSLTCSPASPASSSASPQYSRTTTPVPGPRSGSASWAPRVRASCSSASCLPPCSSACSPLPDMGFISRALTNNVRCRFCVV
ncbi:hypothetical protein VPH35_094253 [Triticum aestivum]